MSAQTYTQIVRKPEKSHLRQFFRNGQLGYIHLGNSYKKSPDASSIELSLWVFAIVRCIILKWKPVRPCSTQHPAQQHQRSGRPRPGAVHPSELDEAQSQDGKRLPKHVKMKNGTRNIYFECDMGDL